MGKILGLFGGSSGASVEPYSEQGPGTPIGGSRRRRRSLRRPKRKGSHKRSRRHYGGKSQKEEQEEQEQEQKEQKEQQEQQEQQEEQEDQDDERKGGSRRIKSSRGKKTKGKTSAWIKHVLHFAKANKMKYGQALKDKRCRSTYKSQKK